MNSEPPGVTRVLGLKDLIPPFLKEVSGSERTEDIPPFVKGVPRSPEMGDFEIPPHQNECSLL